MYHLWKHKKNAVTEGLDPDQLHREASQLRRDAKKKRREHQQKEAEELLTKALEKAQNIIEQGRTSINRNRPEGTNYALSCAEKALMILDARWKLEKKMSKKPFDADLRSDLFALFDLLNKS